MAAASLNLLYLTPKTLSLHHSSAASAAAPSLFAHISLKPLPKLVLNLSSITNYARHTSRFVRNVAVSSELEEEDDVEDERGEFSPDLKLFVGNLPFTVDSAALAGLFEQAGNVEMVEVIYDKLSGRSRGFAFVTMSSVEEAEAAAQQFNGYELQGRPIRVNSGPPPPKRENSFGGNRGQDREFSSFGGRGRERENSSYGGRGRENSSYGGRGRENSSYGGRGRENSSYGGRENSSYGGRERTSFDNTNRVYVGNLSWGVDDQTLESVFSEQGKVKEAKVVYDRENGRSRGFGFVTYSSVEEVNNAVESLDGMVNPAPKLIIHCYIAMASLSFTGSQSVRFQHDLEIANSPIRKKKKETAKSCLKNTEIHTSNPFHDKKLSRVFSEDYSIVQKKILDPRGPLLSQWNKCFLISCLVSLFIDPLFFYLPSVEEDACMQASVPLEIVLTVIRSIVDVFYIIQILVRFRTAYVAPSSRVYGRGELVIDSSKIASRYLHKDFWLDVLSALPLPQNFVILVVASNDDIFPFAAVDLGCNTISERLERDQRQTRPPPYHHFSVSSEVLPHFPLSSKIIRTTGVVVEAAWAGAAFNLMLFMLASHVIGSCWYLLSIERQEDCWKSVCDLQQPKCRYFYFDCQTTGDPDRLVWFESSNISKLCGPSSEVYAFGIYRDALFKRVAMSSFLNKYSYCLWWGLRNLSSAGQNLVTSTYIGEINFAMTIAILGLVFFALLIGNMQVPLFDEMDGCTLDAICERLKPFLCTPGTCLVREGDPVIEMLFILRGRLESYTTNGGRTGFFNSCHLGSGDFCGEELLSWALYPRPSHRLPSSTRTVMAITEVEAFALVSEDVKFVASQFRKMHSKQLKHKFRFHSQQWRTWAACFIQAAWFRCKRRKEADLLKARENVRDAPIELVATRCASLPPRACEFAMHAAQLASSSGRAGSLRNGSQMEILNALQKPVEPDFSIDDLE
ncbi:hypothetical protein BUALT_Bualt09G0075600 [Buddleja alternifolia]|uniref:Uncharacterized protein n=1 Tax=Buddleja alternifolia TaxID=168488 RepID=A0AAV6XBF4_9LAMI|nr:hypothetical protein BUALT_Bualt09G0075600 [Buddleja alternifolia]